MKTARGISTRGTVLIVALTMSYAPVYASETYLNADMRAQRSSMDEEITSSSIDAEISPGGEFSLSHEDASTSEVRKGQTAEDLPVSPEWVESEKDLRAYAGVVMRTQPHVQELTVSDNTVSLEIKDETRLLGLLSISFPVTIEADATGTVHVRYPWYSFATTDRSDAYETRVKSLVEPLFEDVNVLTSGGSFTAYGQALVVDELLAAHAMRAL